VVRMTCWLGTWLPLKVIWGRKGAVWYAPRKAR
jgi:hypothetical protein